MRMVRFIVSSVFGVGVHADIANVTVINIVLINRFILFPLLITNSLCKLVY